jgi:uncharacterized protein (TIGR02145 family)
MKITKLFLGKIITFALCFACVSKSVAQQSENSSIGLAQGTSMAEVKIGNQTWLTQNLNVDKFRNGDLIPEAKTNEEWEKAGSEGKPAWCYYENDPSNGVKFGKLYNWYTITDIRMVAPEGWKIPTFNDFTDLVYSINNEDNLLFSKDPKGMGIWYSGDRNFQGEFYNLNQSAHLWSSSMNNEFNAKYQLLGEHDGYSDLSEDNRGAGFSVRLIKENNNEETETINGITFMKKNLNSIAFRNGDKIKIAISKEEWLDACRKGLPICCNYNFDPKMENLGYLYNYNAFTDERNIAPEGYRLLTENDNHPETLTIKMNGGTLAGQNGEFFGVNEFSLFWSRCTDSDASFNKYCFWKILPENSPIMFETFPENQGMFIRCIKE